MNRKFMAALLAMVMVIGMLPTSAMAARPPRPNVPEQPEEPPHVHDYSNQTTLSEGTCTTPAQFWVYCDCGDGFEVEGAVNSEAHYAGCPHEKEQHVHDYCNQTTLSEGTCTTPAQFWVYCDCGDAFEVEGAVNAEAHYAGCPHSEEEHVHDYCNQITLSEGTCTTPAQFWVYCDCGDAFEVDGIVNAEAHYAGCPHEKEHVHKYEKTVLSEGTCITKSEYWFACECGDAYKEEGELNANGHLYSNGVCLLCNAAAPADSQEPVEEIAYATASTAGLDNVPKTGSAFVEWLYALIFG